MKNVVIFHGTEESPEHFWYPWLINNLRVRNIPVRVKPMPEGDAPPSVIREKFSLKDGNDSRQHFNRPFFWLSGYLIPFGKSGI